MGMVVLPPDAQAEFATALQRIRAGDFGEEVQAVVRAMVAELVAEGAELVIAGSASLPLVLRREDLRVDIIDPIELLARRCVAVCLGLEPAPQVPAG